MSDTHKLTLHIPVELHQAMLIYQGKLQMETGVKNSMTKIVASAIREKLEKEGILED